MKGCYRCSMCALNYPRDPRYKKCLECGEPTDVVSNVAPMPTDEAKQLWLHHEFERFYSSWDAQQKPLAERCPIEAVTEHISLEPVG